MTTIYQFERLENPEEVLGMEQMWLKSLLSPQDGMWESFRKSSEYWLIKHHDRPIGYFNLHPDFGLIQYYLRPGHDSISHDVFGQLVENCSIKNGMVGSNNPIYYQSAQAICIDQEMHTYLFQLEKEASIENKPGEFKLSTMDDLNRLVEFTKMSIGAPEGWIRSYTADLIHKREHYHLQWSGDVVGTSEVRKSNSQPGIADIGMIVNPKYRRKGYGTFLLQKAKLIAIEKGLTPICSTEVNNIASVKSIRKCGFTSKYHLMKMEF